MRIVGIDFGAKLAGTTVGCVRVGATIEYERCAKGEDADRFVEELVKRWSPTLVGIDAPLSLPTVYRRRERDGTGDYFYRAADRALGAMSPLFLGGLSARAMRLRDRLDGQGIEVIEVYPAALVRQLGDTMGGLSKAECGSDRGKLASAVAAIARWGELVTPREPATWHDVDSFLALVTVSRFQAGRAHAYGDPEEGLIHV
jgi:predicted nuclease with RNAse H fold